METNFLISDNIWAKARVPNESGKVGLWLGANVMVEYTFDDAIVLLGKNLANAQAKIAETDGYMDFLKDQITTTEVNMARVYNQGLANKQAEDKAKQAKEGKVWKHTHTLTQNTNQSKNTAKTWICDMKKGDSKQTLNSFGLWPFDSLTKIVCLDLLF